MKAVILCAGLGTRLRPLTDTIPKVMVPIGGKPLLQHHIEWLVGSGIQDIGINLFYLPEVITEFLGDGSRFGACIHYSRQDTLSETATGFKKFKDFVGDDSCLVVYGDNFFSLDTEDFLNAHRRQGALVSVLLKEWEHPESKGIVGQDNAGRILWFKEKPKKEEITTNIGNAGIYLVEPEIFSYIPDDRDYDFGKDIFPSLLKNGVKMFGYRLSGHHLDIGTPEALAEAEGVYKKVYSQKAVFFDRDGVLNKKAPPHEYVTDFNRFEWNEGAKELIKEARSLGYQIIVISNQQGIAKGKMTKKFVDELHEKMNGDLRSVGTKIDAFYYCPHLENEGCACRKPKSGLFWKAIRDHRIDPARSFTIGDSESDIKASENAGVVGILVATDILNVSAVLKRITL
ncbi:MAG: HAD-IIIA family hydrolase [Candidatus Pacebacteria bacterium]|jgi:histidinol-phosphate phosphatase family protein|nr:HAD-IIIA family hydrolase [Candidatus Paceibacterota bacterium]